MHDDDTRHQENRETLNMQSRSSVSGLLPTKQSESQVTCKNTCNMSLNGTKTEENDVKLYKILETLKVCAFYIPKAVILRIPRLNDCKLLILSYDFN